MTTLCLLAFSYLLFVYVPRYAAGDGDDSPTRERKARYDVYRVLSCAMGVAQWLLCAVRCVLCAVVLFVLLCCHSGCCVPGVPHAAGHGAAARPRGP